MTKQEQFFFDNGGFSYDPKVESADAGKLRCAREMAKAETWALQEGYWFDVEHDCDADESWLDGEPQEYQDQWRGKGQSVVMYSQSGEIRQSLGGCYGDQRYMRVVKAELALEEMSSQKKKAKVEVS
jgi:hypothetical protein